MRDLIFLHDDNGAFADYSLDAKDYIRDPLSLTYTDAEDYIYLGLRKPFYQVFAELTSMAGLSLSFEYSTAASFNALSVDDDTKNFSRSGFIKWSQDIFDNWKSQTVNGLDKYWIRFKLGADTTLALQGLNMVFSDDNDLEAEVRQVSKLLAKGDSSFIAYHVASRNEILQRLRNSGNATLANGESDLNELDQWDILRPSELRQASKYLTLAKIYFDASTEIDDKDYQRYKEYMNAFGDAYKLYFRSIDTNDDGKLQTNESMAVRGFRIFKV